ncbi:hypothetical protein PR202_ga11612 [Eleusine coracana subsp. coracana]|uniref:Uncharacterized protein n=1 Tax=Eleusine coracana subsp. coracana TaxID=191504 RepID=A0AAV5C9Z3_ELECO|nr:hypothetical protein PR202_ga11612 [Eleusine coracana subsp. coracana]
MPAPPQRSGSGVVGQGNRTSNILSNARAQGDSDLREAALPRPHVTIGAASLGGRMQGLRRCSVAGGRSLLRCGVPVILISRRLRIKAVELSRTGCSTAGLGRSPRSPLERCGSLAPPAAAFG